VFTGLIEEMGEIAGVADGADGRCLRVRAARVGPTLTPGASIAVNGVCQTVTAFPGPAEFAVTAVGETLRRTTLGSFRPGRRVNLERPLRVGDRLDGHWVNGHVDGKGRILDVRRQGRDVSFRIGLPDGLGRFVVEKGSIAVDGVSLTVGEVDAVSFRVYIIPKTRELTLFGTYRAGDEVNIEADILAKYAAKAMAGGERAAGSESAAGGERSAGCGRTAGVAGTARGAAGARGAETADGAEALGAWRQQAREVFEAWERGDR
jgi:riboflavin synthase